MNESKSKESVIIGTQLKKARELLQLTPEEVAQQINVSPKEIVNWEKEQLKPNLKQLEALAKLYGREIDYFLRETPTPPEEIAFRRKPGENLTSLSNEAKMVLARFDELCRTALEFENLLNKKFYIDLTTFEENNQPKTVAQSLRKKLNINDKPLPDLRNRIEDLGVRIFELPVPEDAFSGFS